MEEKKNLQTCRFYEKEFPEEEDLVVVKVVNVEENASYVSLEEYNKIQGMITPSELTTAYKQSIHKALKIGKQEVARVLRVDKEKGYIDLSKRLVHKDDELLCLDKYEKSKICNAMLVGISESTGTPLTTLYEQIIWPIYRNKNFVHPLEAFQQTFSDETIISNLECSEQVKEELYKQIKRRLTPQTVRIKAEFELFCPGYEGVNAIKAALKAGVDQSQGDLVIKFYIVGSPKYSGSISTWDKNKGIKLLEQALQKVKEEIQKYQGKYTLLQEPKVYGGDRTQEEFENYQQEESEESGESDISGMGED